MNDVYHNGGLGSQSAKLSKQSMSPMMRYQEEDLTLLDSYVPNLIDDIEAQAEQFDVVNAPLAHLTLSNSLHSRILSGEAANSLITGLSGKSLR